MANTQGFCNQAKIDILKGLHALGTSVIRAGTTKDTLKAALYLTSATVDKTTTAYSSTNEVTGTNYSAGGVTVTNATEPALDGDIAHWTPSASITFTNVTLGTSFNCLLIYNDTSAGKLAIAVYTFGEQTVTAADFELNMPTNDGTTGLLRNA